MVTALGSVIAAFAFLFYVGHKFKNFRPVVSLLVVYLCGGD